MVVMSKLYKDVSVTKGLKKFTSGKGEWFVWVGELN